METEVLGPAAPGSGAERRSTLNAMADHAGQVSAFVSAIGLLAIAAVICWEVFTRYVRNEPTSWVTEIATYLLVAVAFLGLAAAQRANAHIHVELVVDMLPAERRRQLTVITNWIGFFFVMFCCWQVALFVYGEYRNGTRDWGLLGTPQWIPETPILIGFILFGIALLAENMRLHPPRHWLASWFVLAGAARPARRARRARAVPGADGRDPPRLGHAASCAARSWRSWSP